AILVISHRGLNHPEGDHPSERKPRWVGTVARVRAPTDSGERGVERHLSHGWLQWRAGLHHAASRRISGVLGAIPPGPVTVKGTPPRYHILPLPSSPRP